MSVPGMRAPSLSGPRLWGLRVGAVAALAAVVTLLGAAHHPALAALAARTGAAYKPASKAHALRKHGKAHKAQRVARRARKQKRHRAAKRRPPLRVIRRTPDPQQLVIAQGDGSPILQSAAAFLGRPYRFGSDSGAYDCSGFVRQVFAKIGIALPHSARDLFARGERVRRDDLEPGDLVFFRTYRRYATHVGIYVGEDKFVHAATRGGQVQVDSLNEAYYAARYLGARRLEI